MLDAILGEKDGVWVLENMKQQQIQCVCIMISAIDSDVLVRRAIAMGADYYMAKPIQGELLLERIRQLTEVRTVYMEPSPGNFIQPLQNNQHQMSALEVDISAILSRMGIPASIKGYHFIRRAVFMAVENREVMVGITKGLYPRILTIFLPSDSLSLPMARRCILYLCKIYLFSCVFLDLFLCMQILLQY